MIDISHAVLPSQEQMEFVIEGIRNPMNSWKKSDSEWGTEARAHGNKVFIIGDSDISLMNKLSKAGTDHRKFMRMIPVMVRITAPLYWWKEFDTYKVGTVSNSCSTMHKIQEKRFDFGDFSMEHLLSTYHMDKTISYLNYFRDIYLNGGIIDDYYYEPKNKDVWWQMIQLLPSSYNQTRNVMLNYEVLANIYHSRKDHKLDEWKKFCKWIEDLPYSELITG